LITIIIVVLRHENAIRSGLCHLYHTEAVLDERLKSSNLTSTNRTHSGLILALFNARIPFLTPAVNSYNQQNVYTLEC
jgi:hypothetical protein